MRCEEDAINQRVSMEVLEAAKKPHFPCFFARASHLPKSSLKLDSASFSKNVTIVYQNIDLQNLAELEEQG